MKKIFLSLLFAAITMSVWGAVTPFDYNGLHFQTNDAEDEATLLKSDDYKSLTEVVIPDSAYWEAGAKMLPVTALEDECFENCTLLKKATAGKALDRPYGNFFKGCTALKYLVIRFSNGSSAMVPDATLQQLDTLEFAPTATAAASNYLSAGLNLKVLKLYNTNVCSWDWNLKYAAGNLENLERVEINDNSSSLMIENGAVYSKNGKTLYLLPRKRGATSFAVREGCTWITEAAFKGNTTLESVTIPSSVATMGSYAFQGCTALTSIDLSECALTSISTFCFKDCEALATITLSDKITTIYQDPFLNTAYVNTASNWDGGFLYLGDVLLSTKPAELSGDITIKNGTRVLACQALSNLTAVTGVTLPESVKYINNNAFSRCNKLTNMDLSHIISLDGYAFSSCSKLATVTFGPDISLIGSYAFQACDLLTSVSIPKGSVPESTGCPYYGLSQAFTVHIPVGTMALYSASAYYSTCAENMTLEDDLVVPGARYADSGLQYKVLSVDDKTAAVTWETRTDGTAAYASLSGAVEVPEEVTLGGLVYTVTEVDSHAFYLCTSIISINLPKSIEKIGYRACYGANNLETVTVASGGVMTEVGVSAFEQITKLTSVTLPSTVEIIDDKAFRLTGLTTFPMPTALKKVGEEAFYCCYNLPNFVLSEGIEEIGYSAFCNVNLVERAYLPSTVKSLGIEAFRGNKLEKWEVHADNSYFWAGEDGVLYNKDKTVLIGTFKKNTIDTLVIPETVTSMYDFAFASNSNLKSVVFPTSLKDIPSDAFQGCTALRKLDLRHVQTIGYQAFYGCTAVDTILLGSDLQSVGDEGFGNIYSSGAAGSSRPAFYFICEAVDVPSSRVNSFLSLGAYAPTSGKKFLVPLESVTLYRKTNYWKNITGLKGYTYWTITANDAGRGNVSGGDGMIIEGEEITISATPKKGYKFVKWSDNDEHATRTITVTTDHANLALEAQFDEKPIDVGSTFQDTTAEGVLVTYKVLTKADGDKTVQVGDGTNRAINQATPGELTIPAQVSYLSDVYDVVALGDYAFKICSGITKLNLPNSITKLGSSSIYECGSLKDVNIPNQLESLGYFNYAYLTSMTEITIPASVKYIGYGAFTYCTKLATINGWNPGQFERVGDNVGAMNTPFFTNNLETEEGFKYSGTIVMGRVNGTGSDTMIVREETRIVTGAIGHLSDCEHISFPASVTAIGGGALGYYPVLKTCTIQAVTPPLVYKSQDVEAEVNATYLIKSTNGWETTTTPADVKYYVPKSAIATYNGSDKWNMLDLRPIGGWTVTFKDHNNANIIDPQQVEQGNAAVKPTEVAAYYTTDYMYVFANDWTIDANGGDTIYTAKYTQQALPQYNVAFYPDEATAEDTPENFLKAAMIVHGKDASAKANEAKALLIPLECQKFLHWTKDGSNPYDVTTITENVKLYPIWQENATFTVIFKNKLDGTELLKYDNNIPCHYEATPPTSAPAGYHWQWDSNEYLSVTKDLVIEGLLVEDNPTGFDNIQIDNAQGTKVLHNGSLYILHGAHIYDAQGKMVK
ncbi:MAG: leucine-rich repeat protein [Paludibacteraceae bacterium]|nr:leucine-rich repeat protein [Paludibacteraceae bacterium]